MNELAPVGGSTKYTQNVSKIAQIYGTENLRYCNVTPGGNLSYTREVITSEIPKAPVVFKMYSADSYINFSTNFIVAGEIMFQFPAATAVE